MMEVRGIEPLTSGLQSPRSAKLSYTPVELKAITTNTLDLQWA